MNADLTCRTCNGKGWLARDERLKRGSEELACPNCHAGYRTPTLREWFALNSERDRYHRALDAIAFGLHDRPDLAARAALDSDPDLAERTRRIRADE